MSSVVSLFGFMFSPLFAYALNILHELFLSLYPFCTAAVLVCLEPLNHRLLDPVHIVVNHRSDIKCQKLGNQQSSDNCKTEGTA